jgi:hypothetical protein
MLVCWQCSNTHIKYARLLILTFITLSGLLGCGVLSQTEYDETSVYDHKQRGGGKGRQVEAI